MFFYVYLHTKYYLYYYIFSLVIPSLELFKEYSTVVYDIVIACIFHRVFSPHIFPHICVGSAPIVQRAILQLYRSLTQCEQTTHRPFGNYGRDTDDSVLANVLPALL